MQPEKRLLSKIIPENNFRHFLILLFFGVVMFFIRTFPIYTRIFTDWPADYGNFVNFSADDAVYHMRFVHNTIHHFPFRVFFDPFTHFPYGSHIHFGPLFSIVIASAAWVIGLGSPSIELINHVGAYTPPVIGVLCLIPLYLIVRKLFGKNTAIISSFVFTFSAGEFLNRSALGFTDHHVAEVFFSTITCTLLVYTLSAAKISKSTIDNIKKNSVFLFGLFTSITYGLFLLTWQGALMFGVIFLIFFITQLLVDHIKNNDPNYLLSLAALIYFIPAIMLSPYTLIIPFTLYPSSHILISIIMFVIFFTCYLLHIVLKKKKLLKYFYPLALAATFILIFFVLKEFFPKIYTIMNDGINLLFNPPRGWQTISEARPSIFDHNGKLSILPLWYNLFWSIPLGLIGLGRLIYKCYKNQCAIEIFLLIWTFAIIIATFFQIRFNYYLIINAAILSGYGIYSLLSLVSYLNFQNKFLSIIQSFIFFVLFLVISLLIVSPILMLLTKHRIPSGAQIKRDWYNTLIWIKKHTPNPQGKIVDKNFDYYTGYYKLPKNLDEHLSYPKSAYGIMTWWDTGHQITYIAERIPNSTPFQLGIIEKNSSYGAAPFFVSTDENEAMENLNAMGSRYVIVTLRMTSPENINSMGIWCNNTDGWTKLLKVKIVFPQKVINFLAPTGSKKFLQSITNRLFYNDADGLSHLRLIYESEGVYNVKIRQAILAGSQVKLNTANVIFQNYNEALDFTKKVNSVGADKNKVIFAYYADPPAKAIKIFENVKGAIISGNISKNIADDTEIKLSIRLKTKYDREFTYSQTTKVKNSKYEFIVPYPTTVMVGDDYSYDITPISNYIIEMKDKTFEVFVPEEAVMLGKSITSDITA